jgi:hypothetical protein
MKKPMGRRTVGGAALAVLAAGAALSVQSGMVSNGAPAASSMARAQGATQEYAVLQHAQLRRAPASSLSLVANPTRSIGPVWTRASAAPRPVIDLLTTKPDFIPGGGGSVLVRVKVRHALCCAFRGQRVANGPVVLRQTVNCAAGRASVQMLVADPATRTFLSQKRTCVRTLHDSSHNDSMFSADRRSRAVGRRE